MNLEDFKSSLDELIKDNLDEIRREVACAFASAILYETKHEVDHSYDPSWDRSGNAFNTHEEFNVGDYDTFEDFLRECNGNTTASFESGHGLFHDDYEDEFQQLIFEMVTKCRGDHFSKMLNEHKEELLIALNMDENCDEDDLFEQYHEEIASWDTIDEYIILEDLQKISAKELFKEGEFLARQRQKQYEESEKRRVEEEKARKEKALEIFKKMEQLYINDQGIEFDKTKKIEASNFKPFKIFLDKYFTKEEQVLLSYCLYTSNSVECQLRLKQ